MICVYGWPSLGKTSAFNINVHIGKDEPVAVAKSSNQKRNKERNKERRRKPGVYCVTEIQRRECCMKQ